MQVGALTPAQVDELLGAETIARIGCHAGGRTYVVPVAYAYEQGALYVHSFEGKKLDMMRNNPAVCVEVDHVEGPADWRSVIGWGRFEELAGSDAEHALELVMERCPPPSREGVMFRIALDERSGRFAASR